MSRRKQSHPKSIKESSKDTIEDVCRSHNLPNHILHLRELTNDPELEYTVHSISTILQGSQFGPFSCTILDANNEENLEERSSIIEFPSSNDSSLKTFVNIENSSGLWLQLLRKSSDHQQSNVRLHLQDNNLWCEVTKNISPDMELVASLVKDGKSDVERIETSQKHLSNDEDSRSVSPSVVSVIDESDLNQNIPPVVAMLTNTETHQNCFNRKEKKLSGGFRMQPHSETFHPRATFSLIHICMFCGVRFSNPRTLQAHLTNYCSKKPTIDCISLPNQLKLSYMHSRLFDESPDASPATSPPDQPQVKVKSQKRHLEDNAESGAGPSTSKIFCKVEHCTDGLDDDDDDQIDVTTNDVKETDRFMDKKSVEKENSSMFECPLCSFSTDNNLNWIEHTQIHLESQRQSDNSSPDNIKSPVATKKPMNKFFCTACNIHFSSFSTYKGHRKYYCPSRLQGQQTIADVPSSSDEKNNHTINPFGSPSRNPMQLFSPGSNIFPPPMFPSPCLPPSASSLFVSQAQAIFLAAAPFFGASNLPSMTFNVPIVVQPVAPILTNKVFQRERSLDEMETVENDRLAKVKTSSSSSSSASSDEKPLDLSTRKTFEKIQNTKKLFFQSKTEMNSPKSDSDQRSRSPVMRSPAINVDGSPSSHASPPVSPKSSMIKSPFSMSHMLGTGSNSLSSPPSSNLTLPPSVSKCLDCNIVFYKHENYIAHKEHYCAGRLSKLNSGSGVLPNAAFGRSSMRQSSSSNNIEPSPAAAALLLNTRATEMTPIFGQSSPDASTSIPTSSSGLELVATLDQGILQYYCIPCKIKFSSLDTLKAHKKFYCPSRLNSSPSDSTTSPTARSINDLCNGVKGKESGDSGSVACTSCGNNFASRHLLMLHYCTGTMAHYPLFHCPYCDYIAQSDSRLVDHIKAHAPSKAYKCVLCGYRGNTVRGMRMHGKMHNDAGETFTDESMIEYEEPPMIPKRLRPTSGEPVLGADMEVELIRMKNEPYKRRRSRKAYEKSEFCHGQAPIRCVECKAMLPDADHLQIHMRGHVTEKILAMKTFDPSLATAAGMIHLQSRLYPGSVKLSMENKLQDANETEFATADNRLQPRNSRESNEGSSDDSVVEAKHSIGNEELSKNAKQSDTFTNSNCISHQKIKEEPTETETNSANDSTPDRTKVQNGKLSPPQNDDDIPVDSSIVVNSTKCDSDVVENNAASEETETDCEDSKSTTKYCKQCNITFMYLSTFIAHKKYYCSSHAGERANAISTGADGPPELLGAASTSVG